MEKPKINIKKLTLMRDNLINNVSEENFNMQFYSNLLNENCECGSVGCIIGNSIKLDMDDFFKIREKQLTNNNPLRMNINLSYFYWSFKFLELELNNQETEKLWDYLFSEGWSKLSPTKNDAINRINYVIENNTYDKN